MPKITAHTIDRIDLPSFVALVTNDDDIKSVTTELSSKSNIVAHNFTRDVFRSTHTGNSRWTPLTTSARGLFTRGQEVVGRGFPKFFALAEVKTEDEDLSSFAYPVHVYHKWNGFLAIAFYTKEDGLIITNKSGVENSYNTIHIANLVVDKTPGLKEKLTSFLSNHPTLSVTLEIIAPEENDKHIVVYSKDIAVPLSVIDNASGDIVTDYDELFDIKPVHTLSNRQELNDFVQRVKRDETDLTEGYVLRGANGYQIKLKTPYYLRAKSVRGRLDKSIPLHNINKLSWPYGGKKWFIEAASNHIEFTPEWAEKMQLNK